MDGATNTCPENKDNNSIKIKLNLNSKFNSEFSYLVLTKTTINGITII